MSLDVEVGIGKKPLYITYSGLHLGPYFSVDTLKQDLEVLQSGNFDQVDVDLFKKIVKDQCRKEGYSVREVNNVIIVETPSGYEKGHIVIDPDKKIATVETDLGLVGTYLCTPASAREASRLLLRDPVELLS